MEHFEKAQQSRNPAVAIAEEDPRLRRIIRLNLEREGIKAIEATSMADCQAYLHKGDAKLAIISAQLPGFDAAQFSRWLRSEFPNKPVPVVVLSFEPEDRLLTHPLRKAVFKQKPFDPADLVGQVSKLMLAV
ncbi:MAG: response regulator [Chloroflexota bacterium]|jgi:DNA-binding response OmpR family regulator